MWWGEFYLGLTIVAAAFACWSKDRHAIRATTVVMVGWILSNIIKGSAAYHPMHNVLLDAAMLTAVQVIWYLGGKSKIFLLMTIVGLLKVALHTIHSVMPIGPMLYAQVYNVLFAIPVLAILFVSSSVLLSSARGAKSGRLAKRANEQKGKT